MKKNYIYFFLLFFAFSCSEKEGLTTPETVEKDPKNQTLEEMVNRHVEAQLSIPANEKYTLKIFREHLDGDDKIDAIVTVNRLAYALEEAIKSGNSAKQAEIGFTGNYNYLFYYDGHSNRLSPAIAISSSPHAELKVKFEHISSEAYKDILVDYTIRNSAFRNIFTVTNHTPFQVFQWKIYDRLGEENPEATYFEYAPGSYSLAKDILIYNGTLENASNVKDIYKFDPKISKKGELLHRFFYYEEQGKYYTNK